ncbi:ATP-binding protein [Pontibacillus marinus]|uniref:Histidine kinase/HSP90-like ATPase domain-containing protein n=1 Tax=Pontibacillus marinus BH030004 = DSM 16465 TaxID=1385511 RepID=A0A0A5GIP0_9BACI|nr:ATP-binding protein [Pontibacillus marinus]KGX91889.1 hypothetical protein N783_00675 [Pontibacillus marinus BH030004 = DSM 16465]
MPSLFRKVFHRNESKKTELNFPTLPNKCNLLTLKRKVIIGTLARDLAFCLFENQKSADSLFYYCLTNEEIDDEKRFIHLATNLVEWVELGEDIEDRIHKAVLSTDVKDSLLTVFNKHKADLYILCQKQDQKTKSQDISEDANQHDQSKWKIYRDVIYAATQKQFKLIEEHEIEQYKTGDILLKENVDKREDIPKCRDLAKEVLQEIGISSSSLMSWLLVISEAVTNILKHADHGKVSIFYQTDYTHVIVEDVGPGFDLENLPNMTLMSGYSTKESLGQGFTLMMKIVKQMMLHTSSKGSTLILAFENDGS